MNRLTVCLVFLLGVVCLVTAGSIACSEEALQAEISGRITLPNGSAAAGAKVDAVDLWKNYEIIGTATADESGRYTMSVPPGKYSLRVSHGVHVHFSPTSDALIDAKADAPATGPVDVVLSKGCIVHGSLIDSSTGQMVGGADVFGRNGEHAVTNNDGSFQIILPRQRHTLTAVKSGYYQPLVHIDASNRDIMAVVMETKPGGIIRGRITDEQGNPIQGASVGAPTTFFDFQRTMTDAEGNYKLEGFDANAYMQISASKEGYDYERKSAVSFPPGEREMSLDFTLHNTKTRTITGRVSEPDGSPSSDARIAYGWSSCTVGYTETRTAEDGSFQLIDVDTAKNIVMAHKKGFAPAFVFVEPDEPADVELQLKPGHILEGRFVDEAGEPVSGIYMSICVEDPAMDKMGFCGGETYRWLYSGIRSGDDGTFKLDSLPEKRIVAEIHSEDYSGIDGLRLEVDRTDHVITLKPRGEIAGKVVRADTGEPVNSFKARVTFSSSRKPGDLSSSLTFGLTEGMNFTPADGTFSISGLTNGATFRVEIEAPGYRRAAVDRVLVQSKGTADPSELIFKLHPAVSFEGSVVDEDSGAPVEGVLVTVIDSDARFGDSLQWRSLAEMAEYTKQIRTDAEGRFKVDHVGSRSGHIALEKPGYARTFIRNVSFLRPTSCSLSKGASISGVIGDEAGSAKSGAYISVRWLGKGRQSISFYDAEIDADGKFTCRNLPGGRYTIEQRGSGNLERMIETDIAPGEDYVVDWNRPGEAVLEGVVTLEGQPVKGAKLLLHPVGGWMYSGSAKTGDDGSYRVSLYEAGSYKVTISQGEWTDANRISVRKIAELEPGTNRLNVEFPSAQISGMVLDDSFKPAAGVTIRAYRRQTEQEYLGATHSTGDWSWQHTEPIWWPKNTATTDEDGKFEMNNLDGGVWLVAATGGGSPAAHTGPFTLEDKQKKHDALVRLPQPCRAEVGIIDATTGKNPENSYVVMVDEFGFVYYPSREEDGNCGSGGCSPMLSLNDDGRFVFSPIPPGSYRAMAVVGGHAVASADVKVIAGTVTPIDLEPQAGPKVVFRLKETQDDAVPGIPWLGYSITRAGTGEPVLEDDRGPTFGDILFFGDSYPREVSIPIQPGKYDLKAGLRQEASSSVIMAHEDIWSYEGTIEVKDGEDVEIEVDWRGE